MSTHSFIHRFRESISLYFRDPGMPYAEYPFRPVTRVRHQGR